MSTHGSKLGVVEESVEDTMVGLSGGETFVATLGQ